MVICKFVFEVGKLEYYHNFEKANIKKDNMALWSLLWDGTVINWLHHGQRFISEQLLPYKACIICSQRVIMKEKKIHKKGLFTCDSVGPFQLEINFMPCIPFSCRPSANFALDRRKQLSQVVEM